MNRFDNNRLYLWAIIITPFIFFFLAIPRLMDAQSLQTRTPIPGGTISEDTTWTAASSPYDVLGSITVADGATLTIEPGVELYWNSTGHRLTINSGATLAAAGTAVDPITFTSDTTSPGSWRGLYVHSGGQATLAHCEIGYAGSGTNEALYIASTAVTVTDCHIHHSNYRGIQINGVGLSPELMRVQVENSGYYAIYQNTINMTPTYSDLTLSGHSNDAIAINGGTTDRHLTLVPPGSAGEAIIPYRIVGSSNVTIGATQALTLTPGVAIHFTFSNRTLAVNNGAVLYAVGTADQPIIFGDSEDDPGSWHGIVVNDGGQATLAHCQITNGGGAALSGRALLIASSDVTVTDCLIQNSSRDGVNINGAGLSPSLTRVQVENNAQRAITQSTADMTPTYQELSFSNNGEDAIFLSTSTQTTINRHITLAPPGSVGAMTIPYVFKGSAEVAASQVLTVTSGVEVQFDLTVATRFTVRNGGRLHAVGAPEAPVVFRSGNPVPGGWSGIYIDNGGEATLSYCQVNYAGHRGSAGTTSGAIRTASSDVSVTNCRIQFSANEAITANNAQPTIQNNLIMNNGFGVRNETPGIEVNATFNYWGAPSGPQHLVTNPGGQGNAVSDGVLYRPWYGTPDLTPIDLAVDETGFVLPATVDLGSDLTFTYRVQNLSDEPVFRVIEDHVYLSPDGTLGENPRLLTRVFHTGGVAANGSYEETVTVPVLGYAIDDYHIVVVTDAAESLPDPDRDNNIGVSPTQVATTINGLDYFCAVPDNSLAGTPWGNPPFNQPNFANIQSVLVSNPTANMLVANPFATPLASTPRPTVASTPLSAWQPFAQAQNLIVLTNSGFSPTALTVAVGSTVTWRNDTANARTIDIFGDGEVGYKLYLPLVVNSATTAAATAVPISLSQSDNNLNTPLISFTLQPGEEHDLPFATMGSYTYQVRQNPSQQGVLTVVEDLDLSLHPIGDKTAYLGQTLRFQLTASGLGELLFSAVPLPLPPGMTLHSVTGDVSFRPAENQVGSFVVTFRVSDGEQMATETVTITVPPANPGDDTRFSGRILNANNPAQPLVGATVRDLNSGQFTLTNDQGYFLMSDLEPGHHYFEYDASTANPAGTYGAYRSEQILIANVNNVVDRPIYIMPVDQDSATQVDPDNVTVVYNPNLNATLEIPPQTVVGDTGELYTGFVTLSSVPPDFTPGSLPDTLNPSLVLTIQPMGLTFNQPAALTFPNTDGWLPGSEMDFWSMDHTTSQFFIAGRGRVSDDGAMVETIVGGVRESSWHFPSPPRPPGEPPEAPEDGPPPCAGCSGSTVQFNNGRLKTWFTLPAYVSQGQSWAWTLVYESERANPTGLVPLDFTIPGGFAAPNQVRVSAVLGGLTSSAELHVDTAAVGANQQARVVYPLDVAELPTGIYPATFQFTSLFANNSVGSQTTYNVVVKNEQDSPFGAGWNLDGLSRLHYDAARSSILIAEGDGDVVTFVAEDGNLTNYRAQGDLTGYNWQTAITGDLATQLGSGSDQHPSFFVSDKVYSDVTFAGTFRVNNFSEDDFIGLVLGYQAPLEASEDRPEDQFFVLFDWKKAAETVNGFVAEEGFALSCVSGPADIFTRTGAIQTLATEYGDNAGWIDNLLHSFQVNYTPTRVTIAVNNVVIFDEVGNFPPGRIGFFNLSQPSVQYAITSIVDNSGVGQRFRGVGADSSVVTRHPNGAFTRQMTDGTRFEYDAAGLLTAVVDRNDNTTSFAYDGNDRLTSITDPASQQTLFAYSNGRIAAITDPAGRVTSFTHDGQGNLTGVIFPDGAGRSFVYDDRHLMTAETDERNQTVTRTFNQYGQLIGAAWPDGSTRSFGIANSMGLPLPGQGGPTNPIPAVFTSEVTSSFTDGMGLTEFYETGRYGEETGRLDAAGLETIQERDAAGNVTRLVNPSGAAYSHTYDGRGNQLSRNDETLGGITLYAYDETYNFVTRITDPFGESMLFDYDENGNLLQITTPLNRSIQFAYDSQGMITQMTPPWGTAVAYDYDTNGNLVSVIEGTGPEQRQTAITRTAEGYIESATDAEGRQFTYSYDAVGQLTSENLPGGRTITYNYDAAGNILALTPPGRPAHQFTYDELGQVTSYQPPPVANGGTNRTNYFYNDAQQLTQIVRPDGQTITYGFDNAGRINQLNTPLGSYAFTYDPDTGQIAAATEPGGNNLSYAYLGDLLSSVSWTGAVEGMVSYAYDKAGRVSGIGVDDTVVSYAYDADGQLVQVGPISLAYDNVTGLLAETAVGSIQDGYSYNEFGELDSYQAQAGNAVLYDVAYTRDRLGRITQKVETVLGVTDTYDYSYDAAGRLVTVQKNGVTVESYTYDANGNRLSATVNGNTVNATYDDQDRLLTYGNATYTYTANGELLTKTENGQTTSYNYDVMGNLRSVTLPDGTEIVYEIDSADRRIGRSVNGGDSFGLLYQDALNPVAQLDADGNVINRFIYDNIRASVPRSMLQDGVLFHFITDHIGSVRLVVNVATGEIAQRLDYDTFGNILTNTNPGFQPFGFVGGIYEQETGLSRFGKRDYDSQVGRWTVKDPILFDGEQSNLYAYLDNDPLNLTDPTGLGPEKEESTAWETFKTWLGLGSGNVAPSGVSELAGAVEAGVAISASGISGLPLSNLLLRGAAQCSTPELQDKSAQLWELYYGETGAQGNIAQNLQFTQEHEAIINAIRADLNR